MIDRSPQSITNSDVEIHDNDVDVDVRISYVFWLVNSVSTDFSHSESFVRLFVCSFVCSFVRSFVSLLGGLHPPGTNKKLAGGAKSIEVSAKILDFRENLRF